MGFKEQFTFREFVMFLIPSIAVMAFMSAYMIAGGGAFAAIKLGEGDHESASSFLSNLLIVAFSFGALVMLASSLFKGHVLDFLGVNETLYSYASSYSTYTFITFPLLISKMIFAGFLRAQGKPSLSLKMSILGGLINMILDYLFIAVLGMGVAGAGLATMLGIASALLYASRYFSQRDALIYYKLAAIAVILYINFFASMIFQGIAIGVSPLLSFYYGAKNFKALNEIRRYAFYLILGTSILTTAVIIVTKGSLVALFFSGDNAAYRIAIQGLFVVSFAYLFMGMNMYGSALYTAFSNGKISAFISATKTFVIFSIIALIIPKVFGSTGIWLILPMVEMAAVLLTLWLAC